MHCAAVLQAVSEEVGALLMQKQPPSQKHIHSSHAGAVLAGHSMDNMTSGAACCQPCLCTKAWPRPELGRQPLLGKVGEAGLAQECLEMLNIGNDAAGLPAATSLIPGPLVQRQARQVMLCPDHLQQAQELVSLTELHGPSVRETTKPAGEATRL